MSPLRRSPREVYRVYDEDQLPAESESPLPDEFSQAPGAQSVSVLGRLAVAAALVGAVGAVGGIVLATGFGLSATHRRTNGSLAVAADPSVRPGPSGMTSTPATERRVVSPTPGARVVPARQRTGASRGASLHSPPGGGARASRAGGAGGGGGAPRAGAEAVLAGSEASVLGGPARRGHPEFGFER